MVALFKAVPFGAFLTLIVALFMGSGGATGGLLGVFPVDVTMAEYGIAFDFYWSWVLFLIGTLIAFVLIVMLD